MSRSYTRSYGSSAKQSGANQRRRYDEGMSRPRQDFTDEQHGDSTPPQESTPPENRRYQRRDAYTVIAPNEEKRQRLLQVQKQEEETLRRRKEEKVKTPVKITPKPVGGQGGSQREFIEHQQKMANKSQTAKALEMKEKREKWKRKNKEREDKDIESRKAAARLQAEKNERKHSLQKEEVRRNWAEKYINQSTQPSKESSASSNEVYSYGASSGIQYSNQYTQPSKESFARPIEADYTCGARGRIQSQEEDKLVQLCRIFADFDPYMLSELLREQGSVERVCAILE